MDVSKKPLLTATCHCKAIRITFPTPEKALNECQCSVCRRYGALWAYYGQDEVKVEGQTTEFYAWGDKGLEFHRCPKCGCMTHWMPTDKGHPTMAVNGRMLEREDLESLEIKKTEGP
jgi:hypothetical protein